MSSENYPKQWYRVWNVRVPMKTPGRYSSTFVNSKKNGSYQTMTKFRTYSRKSSVVLSLFTGHCFWNGKCLRRAVQSYSYKLAVKVARSGPQDTWKTLSTDEALYKHKTKRWMKIVRVKRKQIYIICHYLQNVCCEYEQSTDETRSRSDKFDEPW